MVRVAMRMAHESGTVIGAAMTENGSNQDKPHALNPFEMVGGAMAFATGAVADAAGQGAKVAAAGAKQAHQMFGGEYGDEFEGTVRDEDGQYAIPDPLLDDKEIKEIDDLTERYKRLVAPGPLQKMGKSIADAAPQQVKDAAGMIGGAVADTFNGLTEQELIANALKVAVEGFGKLEEQAAKTTVGRDYVLQRIDAGKQSEKVSELDEICLLRSYDVAKVVADERLQHMGIAFAEGGGTGAAGFWGLPANLALSMLIYFRAVQSVAMFYGYDVKGDPAEMEIAGYVFSKSMSPYDDGSKAANDYVGKLLMYAETAAVKRAAKGGWQAMAEAGGAALLLAQMRATANKAAQKALEKSGEKALESNIFRNVFKEIGSKLTLKTISKAVPVVGAGFGAFFDTAQMSRVLDFADFFYHKRFILEKPERIGELTGVKMLPVTDEVGDVPISVDDAQ